MRRAAFTLIELLVVIAIIAILIALLVAALSRSRAQSRAVRCQANMRSVVISATMYSQSFDGGFPRWGFGHGEAGGHTVESWVRTIAEDYSNERRVLKCPDDKSKLWPADAVKEREALAEELQDHVLSFRRTSYGSSYYLHAPSADDTRAGHRVGHPFNRVDWVTKPATTIQYVELADTGAYAVADHFHPEIWEDFHPDEMGKVREQMMIDRHLGAANYALADGHAERFAFEKTYNVDDGSSKGDDRIWFYNKYDPSIAK